MAYAKVARASVAGLNGGTTGAVDTTGANLIVVAIAAVNSPTVTDSKSNTYTQIDHFASSNGEVWLFYIENPTVGSGHTFTLGGGLTAGALEVIAFSGGAASSLLDQHTGTFSNSATSLATGSITPTVDNELVVTGVASGAGNTLTMSIDGSFTLEHETPPASGSNYGCAIAWKLQTTAAAVNPTWTGSENMTGIAVGIASFKAAGGGSTFPYYAYAQQ